MARRHPTEAGRAALAAAVELCGRIEEVASLRDQRAELWMRAQDEGCTSQMIATACGVSVQHVNTEIGKARGYPWAVGSRA